MLRVLYVIDRFEGVHGGTEGQFHALLQGLNRKKIEPVILTLRGFGELKSLLSDIEVRDLALPPIRSLATLHKLAELRAFIRSRRIDLVHTYFNDASMILPLALVGTGVKLIVSRRDLGFWQTNTTRFICRMNRALVDGWIANCRSVADSVVRDEWASRSKLHVVNNALLRRPSDENQAAARRRLGLPTDVLIIGVVANLRRVKRILDTVRAVARLRDRSVPRWLLVFAGEGDAREGPNGDPDSIMAVARELGIQDRLELLGKQTDPALVMRALDIGLLCSETEGLSNTLIEYAAAGLPIVCTNVGGNPDLVQHGVNGFLANVGDEVAIGGYVATLLQDRELALAFGDQSASKIAGTFSREAMVSRHEELYAQLCGHRLKLRPARE